MHLLLKVKDALLLKKSISNENRKKENKKRDIYRNPFETLKFFDISEKRKYLRFLLEADGTLRYFLHL